MSKPCAVTFLGLALLLPAGQAAAAPMGDYLLASESATVMSGLPPGAPINDRFGYTVAHGDFDGDGHRDVAVGAPQGDRVLVYLGPITDPIEDWNAVDGFYQGAAGEEAGWSLAAGDFDGDGTDELVVGEPSAFNQSGRVTVLSWPYAPGAPWIGPLELEKFPAANILNFIGPSTSSDPHAGWDVATGDFDGDGATDLLIGACTASDDEQDPFEGPGGARRQLGAVYFVANADMAIPSSNYLEHTATTVFWGVGNTGCSVASAGDFDGDGIDDMLFGSYSLGTLPTSRMHGAAQIVQGGGDYGDAVRLAIYGEVGAAFQLADIPGISTVRANEEGANLGFAVEGVGDINADGFDDILLGAPAQLCIGCGQGRTFEGRAHLMLGGTGLQGASQIDRVEVARFEGPISAGVGRDVAGAGDLDQDGADDILVGSTANEGYLLYGVDDPSTTVSYSCAAFGACTVVLNSPLPPSLAGTIQVQNADAIFHGDPDDFAGMTLDGVGDVTDDGHPDLLFGAPRQQEFASTNHGQGLAYLFTSP